MIIKKNQEAENKKPEPCVKCKGQLSYPVNIYGEDGNKTLAIFPCDSCMN
jgi:hypothetical protein